MITVSVPLVTRFVCTPFQLVQSLTIPVVNDFFALTSVSAFFVFFASNVRRQTLYNE